MPWGTIRQHSTGATWENSSTTVHHSRIFGFLPNFKHTSSLSRNTISGDGKRRIQKSMQPPRGAYYSQPAVSVSRSHTRTRSMQHPPHYTVRSPTKPSHRSMYDDPAFSADPRSHPQFVTTSDDRSRLSSSRSVFSRSQPRQVDDSRRREHPISSRTESEYSHEISESFPLLSHPRGQPYPPSSSNQSLFTSDSATTYASTTSSESPSSSGSHSSNDYSFLVTQPTSALITIPVTRSKSSSSSSSYYEEKPVVHAHSHRPATGARNVSEPDLHPRSDVPAQAPRPMTAPIQDANNRPIPPRRENTRRHNPQRPGELDRIDELDETDPFGSGIHHKGPYEAINAILNGPTNPSNNDGNGFNYGVQKQKSRKHAEPVLFAEGPVFDPSTPLNLVPGQILPRAPIFDLRSLEPTPYHRHHRSHSTPPPPPGIVSPPRHSEHHPPHFPPDNLPFQHEPQKWPEVQNSYDSQHLPSFQHRSSSQPSSRPHSRSHPQPPHQPVPEIRVQPPPESELEYEHQRQTVPNSQPQPQSLPQYIEPPHSQSSPFQPQPRSQSPPRPHSQPPEFQTPPPRSESEPQSQLHRQSHRQSRSSNRVASAPSISSHRSSYHGPTPHHVPKHLVMPTPLQQSNASVSHESASSHVRFYDRGSLSAKVNLQPRAKEISMVPDSRKLLRKRTMTYPGTVPIPVPLGGKPPPGASSKGLFGLLGSRAQVPASAPTSGHRRLSKRKNDS